MSFRIHLFITIVLALAAAVVVLMAYTGHLGNFGWIWAAASTIAVASFGTIFQPPKQPEKDSSSSPNQ